jgi:glycerate kinase
LKIIIVPDSFKGTMSSIEFCELASRSIRRADPGAAIVSIPVADGGEGTVESFLAALGGHREQLQVTGPLWEKTESFYGLLEDGTAVVEMAAAAGLPMVKGRENPLIATTYGVGELIADALPKCKRLVIGLGGSATNDGGCGLAAALGVKFFDRQGKEFIPTGGTLSEISRISGRADMKNIPVTIMCDVDNPLCGPNGAACVFGPQKGASPADVKLLDEGLKHLASVISRDLGADIAEIPGSGAAGGMGGGLYAFLGGELKMGIETVLDVADFDSLLEGADLVITGEGRIDGQSARGKVVCGVAKRAGKQNIPVIAIVGDVGKGAEQLYSQGLTSIFSINRVSVPLCEARPRSRADLAATVFDIARFAKAMRKE